MNRVTIAVVAVFALLAGVVFAIEKTNPVQSDTTVYVSDVKDVDVQRIDIRTPQGTASFERKEPFGWKFTGTEDEADSSRVTSVANRLSKLRSSAKVSDTPADLSGYGLNPPEKSSVLTLKDGTTRQINFGRKTVNDAAYYAMVQGGATLHTVNTLIVGDLEKLVTEPPRPSPTTATGTAQTSTPAPRTATPSASIGTTPEPTETIGLPSLNAP